uniref:O-GlcNAc transferase C-terminal domain-containing protein n=1 Tax=viral metagenome TaxID=1070528 RepID=A0A6C0IAZ7_9ZZZZ
MKDNENHILQFYALCESCLHAKKIDITPQDKAQLIEIYNLGIQIVRANVSDITLCESILYKVLFLFPDSAELHYFMAYILFTNRPNEIHHAGYWFQSAFRLYNKKPAGFTASLYSLDPIENVLDFMKLLFDNGYTQYIQYIFDSYPSFLEKYTFGSENPDSRWLLFLGAYYIKTNQLQYADNIYSILLKICHFDFETDTTESCQLPYEIQYQILNNALVLYMRMAKFTWLSKLLKRNLQICNMILQNSQINHDTKVNLFCSNMLIYDYVYYNEKERLQLCSFINKYYSIDCYPWTNDTKQQWKHRFDWLMSPLRSRHPDETLPSYGRTSFHLVGGKGDECLPTKTQRINIGYVSSDFIHHAVSNFILPILEHHDETCFNITLFFTKNFNEFMNNEKYQNIRQKCTIINLQNTPIDHAINRIRDLHIDVLFDLNGYTEKNRIDIFAKQPAPIQISYIGYPNTVGSSEIMQYRITDRIADPSTSNQWFAEKRLYMSTCFLLFKSELQSEPLPLNANTTEWQGGIPASFTTNSVGDRVAGRVWQEGLKASFTTNFEGGRATGEVWTILGSMNRESKNSDELLSVWKQILLQSTHTKLVIKLNTTIDSQIHMERYYDKLGVGHEPGKINKDRIIFSTYGSTSDYLSLFSNIDIMLDSFPYSGTTTTCNALYNSIPVVTLSHPHLHAHNVSASLLQNCGFPELVASSPEQYIDIVLSLSQDQPRLDRYRKQGEIHQKFQQLMNPKIFMPQYEALIKQSVIETVNTRFPVKNNLPNHPSL